jgi:hypothetical protein
MAEIKIGIGDNGQLGVAVSNDISNNLPLVLGFIELAKSALIDQAKQSQNRVQPASFLPPGLN